MRKADLLIVALLFYILSFHQEAPMSTVSTYSSLAFCFLYAVHILLDFLEWRNR